MTDPAVAAQAEMGQAYRRQLDAMVERGRRQSIRRRIGVEWLDVRVERRAGTSIASCAGSTTY